MIRWGIIGCGDVTEVKSGPGFQKAQGSALAAVMRRDGAKAADYAHRHGVAKSYDNADALIADSNVDAVYVATPPGSHEELAMKVLRSGKPCYMEKPMSRNAAEGRRMVEAFDRMGVPFFVAYYRRAMPRFLKVKEILDSGQLGKINSINYRMATDQMMQAPNPMPWRYDPEIAGGGLLLDVGSHALDLLDFFLGPLTNVQGSSKRTVKGFAVEDQIEMTFKIAGANGAAHWNFATKEPADQYQITGQNGEIKFACFANEPILLSINGKEERFEIPHPPHVAQPLIQTVVDDILGRGNKCPSTGASALRTQEIMDKVLENFYGGREDGFWK